MELPFCVSFGFCVIVRRGAKRKPSISLVMYMVKEKGGLFGVEFYSVECVGVLVPFGK